MDGAGVDRLIIVPPGNMGTDNRYGLECAAAYPDRFAVAGLVDTLAPNVRDTLSTWLQQPGMVGIRTHMHAAFRERWENDEAMDPFWAAAEEFAIPVSVFVPGSVKYAERAAERFPNLNLIIDHLGLPQIDRGFEYPEFPLVLTLARFPNVTVKLSTLASRSMTGYPFVETHTMIKQAYEAFGPDRLLWGTDHTQQLARNRSKYDEEVDLIRKAVDFLTDEERGWILGANACRIYGWPEGVKSTDLVKTRA